jgi:hypothetical protein
MAPFLEAMVEDRPREKVIHGKQFDDSGIIAPNFPELPKDFVPAKIIPFDIMARFDPHGNPSDIRV